MLELEAARERILSVIQPLHIESVSVAAAVGRVVRERIIAPLDLPIFDNSAMDGYAVRSADVSAAEKNMPVRLKLRGHIAAGEAPARTVEPGTCARIFTGSVLPTGADAVVMQEDAQTEGPETMLILESVKPWENVRVRGEDVKQGAALLNPGDRLTAAGASLLAALGLKEIKVGQPPVIALLATGSELVEPGEPLTDGRIYESNRIALTPLLKRAGAVPQLFPLVADSLTATRGALKEAFERCDGVVTTGGVSVGELDLVKSAFQQLGGKLEFWKVAMKPGKPFVFGQWGEKLLFGLPGNPVSAFTTFLLLVHSALLRWQGATDVALPAVLGVLAEPLINRGDRRHFMRIKLDAQGKVHSAGIQASHALSSLAHANGLVDVPPYTTLEAGTVARVITWTN